MNDNLKIKIDDRYIEVKTELDSDTKPNLIIIRDFIGLGCSIYIKTKLKSDNVRILNLAGFERYFKTPTSEMYKGGIVDFLHGNCFYISQETFKECLKENHGLYQLILDSIEERSFKLARYLCNSEKNIENLRCFMSSLATQRYPDEFYWEDEEIQTIAEIHKI